MTVSIIALGSRTACDDEAGLLAAEQAGRRLGERVAVNLAGRPGPGLLDLLDPRVPAVVVDVIAAGLEPGAIVTVPLAELTTAAIAGKPLSSHGLGPAEALRLGEVLGRRLPPGRFVGIEGHRLVPGQGMDPRVGEGIVALVDAIALAVDALQPSTDGAQPCTSPV